MDGVERGGDVMPKGVRNPPISENLCAAADMILKMKEKQFRTFKPRNACEQSVYNLTVQCMRGDTRAFDMLYQMADRAALIDDAIGEIDALSRALQELGESL